MTRHRLGGRMQGVAALALAIGILGGGGCAYYNGFYNAKKAFSEAEDIGQEVFLESEAMAGLDRNGAAPNSRRRGSCNPASISRTSDRSPRSSAGAAP